MEILTVSNLGYGYTEKILYEKSSFKLMNTDHMGVVGANGSGKSTLLSLLLGKISPDEGEIVWSPKSSVGYIDQHVKIEQAINVSDFLRSAYQDLYKKEKEMLSLYQRYGETGEEKLLHSASLLQEELDTKDFYFIEHQIEIITNGLGLAKLPKEIKIKQLGQSQKIKIMLAKILLENPSVLVLDEPTNTLDEEETQWLTGYLQQYPQAFIVVSHDLQFIEAISNCICDISFEKIERYQMNYQDFLKLKALKIKSYEKEYKGQQKKIKETELFIQKNIAGIKTKMAQGRRTQLERMEKLREPEKILAPKVAFKALNIRAKALVTLKDISIGYEQALINHIDLVVKRGDKIVLQGEKLTGKTALMKTILKKIPQIKGQLFHHSGIVLGYFSQELYWEDLEKTPIEILADLHGELTYERIRRELAKFGIYNQLAKRAIGTLSGGEQSKVKLCELTLSPYHVLIFDEPTKHLDQQSKEALGKAIKDFSGSVMVVSQDTDFYRQFADQVLIIEKKAIKTELNG